MSISNKKSLSNFLGQHKSNINRLNASSYNVRLDFDDTSGKYEIIVKEQR